MDVLGAENYLRVQGYTYYGSVFATSKATCGFISEEKLHILPFYDLYAMKV